MEDFVPKRSKFNGSDMDAPFSAMDAPFSAMDTPFSAMDAPSSAMDAPSSAMDDTTHAVSATPAVSTTHAVLATSSIVCTGESRKCTEFAKEGDTLCLRHLQHRAIGLLTDGGFDKANCKFPECRHVMGYFGGNGFCNFHYSQKHI